MTLEQIDEILDELMNVQNQQAVKIAQLEYKTTLLQIRVKELDEAHEKLRKHLDKVYHL